MVAKFFLGFLFNFSAIFSIYSSRHSWILHLWGINHLISSFILSFPHFFDELYGWQRYTKQSNIFHTSFNPVNLLPLSLVILITSELLNDVIIPFITSFFVALLSFFIITYLVCLSTIVSKPHFSHLGYTTIFTSQILHDYWFPLILLLSMELLLRLFSLSFIFSSYIQNFYILTISPALVYTYE